MRFEPPGDRPRQRVVQQELGYWTKRCRRAETEADQWRARALRAEADLKAEREADRVPRVLTADEIEQAISLSRIWRSTTSS